MKKHLIIFSIIAVVMALSCAAGFAAEKPVKIGVLDVPRLYKDAPRIKQFAEQLDAFKKELSLKLEIRIKNQFLSEADINELVDTTIKTNPTDADKARIKVLEDKNLAIDTELKTLTQTNPLNEEQKARQKAIQDIQAKSMKNGSDMEKDYNEMLNSKGKDLDDKLSNEIDAAVKKYAEENSFTFIVDKQAVLFGGIDITDAIISRMVRKAD